MSRSSTRSPTTTNTRLAVAVFCTAVAGNQQRRRLRGLLDAGGGEESRLQAAVGVGHDRLDDQRARVGVQRRRDEAHLADERLAGIGVDLEGQRRCPTAMAVTYCAGTVSSSRSGLTRMTEATFVPRVT